MATWKGEEIEASVEEVENGWLTHKNKKFRWEYHTTSDYLTLFEDDKVLCSFDYERTRVLCKLIEDFIYVYEP